MECYRAVAESLLIPVLLPVQSKQHLLDQIIDIEELQFRAPVIDLNRQTIGNVITKGSNRRIIIRSAPLSEQVREPVD